MITRRLRDWPASTKMMLVGVLLWALSGALYLAGARVAAPLAMGIALILFVAAVLPVPRFRRRKPVDPTREPAKSEAE